VPDGGWPIGFEDMSPYYQKACDLCQIGSFSFNAREIFTTGSKEIIPGLDDSNLVSDHIERWSPPVDFAKTYKSDLEKANNIQVLLNTHAVALEMKDGGEKISAVKAIVGNNKEIQVKARKYILATGGIENARLLLASKNDYFPAGIGNKYDNVGRYYMTHITGTYAKLNPSNREKILFAFQKDARNIFCRNRWWITEKAQKENHLLNTIFYLSFSRMSADRGPVFSQFYNATKFIFSVTRTRKLLRRALANKNNLSPALSRFFSLGYPAILPSPTSKYWGLFFQSEQTPNRNSRVTLSGTENDALGMPRVEMHISFTELDIESIVRAHNLFVQRYIETNAGEIVYSENGLREYLKKKIASYNSYAHHIGTTRMSDSPQTGVVDKNAKVYGVNNLFIVGSSVFSTASHANPTLTIVAQALRLADHLKKICVQ
jgi:choline dehydrogenase-like flavoprotein